MQRCRLIFGGKSILILTMLLSAWTGLGATTNSLDWHRVKERVDADVRDLGVYDLLLDVAAQSGWHVFVEPGLDYKASTKFKNLAQAEALRKLLGDLNYSVVPGSNVQTRLYVFRTQQRNATRELRGAGKRPAMKGKLAPLELTIRVKPGTDVEALARLLRAKIIGRLPELNAYQLQFEDDDTMNWARDLLAKNPDVTSVEDNYLVDVPFTPETVNGMAAPDTTLKLDPPKADACKVIVGLVDTSLQPLGSQLEGFIKERFAVAGESPTDISQPTHATAMANALFQAMQSSGKSSSSVRIISVDVFGQGGAANTFNVAAGMIAAANRGATVINASLGGYGESPLLRDAVQQLSGKNIPVFAAVGNDGSSTPFFPAAYPQVISVTATERGKVASYANVGVTPDVAAPGGVMFSYNGQTFISHGTSVSSAAATGVAAGMADANCSPWSQVIPAIERGMAVPTGP